MKKIICLLTACLICFLPGLAQEPHPTADYRVIPLPKEVMLKKEPGFTLNADTKIAYPGGDATLKRHAELLADYLRTLTGLSLPLTSSPTTENVIELATGQHHPSAEAYRLQVSRTKVLIKGASAAGTFYGIQTFRKSLPVGKPAAILLPAVEITDYPRFAYRGAMLDVARHFFQVDEVKAFIDMLALHHVNFFHWHLTDDQGWRIEIKKYPLLTEKSAFRPETVIGQTTKMDGQPHGGFYTQEQIRDIVRYAADRHVQIIPEIDMPGHMVAALAAYPELGCTGGPYAVRTEWGIADEVLCAGNERTLQFTKDVITEVAELFPGPYINIGGDECPKKNWEKCPKCQAKIKALGLTTDEKHTKEQYLQSYFMSAMADFIIGKGKKVIGWDEILEGNITAEATVLSWRNMEGSVLAARQGLDAIMCPTSHLYFDYYQSIDRANEPLAYNAFTPIERTYDFNPVSDRLTTEQAKHIIGVQANLWTEYIPTFRGVQYMFLPRIAAAAEVQWCAPEQRRFADFADRLPQLLNVYDRSDYNYSTHYFHVKAKFNPARKEKAMLVELNSLKDARIFYTLDGSAPTRQSAHYEHPFRVDTSCVLKAMAVKDGRQSKTLTEPLHMHRGLMKSVLFKQAPNAAYRGDSPHELVNGVYGTEIFRSGRWVGWTGNDMDVVVDLGKVMPVRRVSLRTLITTVDWIFPDRGLSIAVSDDNRQFRTVYQDTKPPLEGTHQQYIHTQKVDLTNAGGRYVRIRAQSEKSLPGWHQGHGLPGFVFVDEIVID